MIDLGLSEMLNKLITGNDASTPHDNLLYSNISKNPMSNWQNNPVSTQPQSFASLSNSENKSSGYTGVNGAGSAVKQSSGGNAGAKTSANSLQTQQDKLRKSLSGSFGSTISAYGDMLGNVSGDQNAALGQLDSLAGTQKNSIHDALNSALEKYTGYRGEVASNQKQTLQDLADNTRNLFAAGNSYLGARGAGDSSATGMYSAALTQQANKQRGDVQNQTNKQYNDINTSEQDTQNQAQQQLDSVETWKATKTSEIVQQYQDLKRQITVAKAQADDSKKAALAQLDASLFQNAINNLNNIQNVSSQYGANLSNSLNTQSQQLGGMTDKVAGSSNYNVQTPTSVPLQGIEQGQTMNDGTITGYYNGRKVQVDQQGNILAYLD